MQEMQRLGIDLMGGDVKPEFIMDAVIQAASYLPNTQFCLFTSKEYVAALHERITYEIVSEVILMEDHPLLSVRKKKDSSLVRGIKALKEKKLDAFISCGNTGALIAASFLHLPLFQSVTKPALLAQFPSRHGPMAVLDVGGNVTAKAELLVEFARVGAAFFCSRFKKKSAQVALLNIGVESEKGTKELQEAYHLLKGMQKDSFTFVGNIEPRDVFTQDVDVLVTSGFAGNIFLKTAEGVASFVFQLAEEELTNGKGLERLKSALSYEASAGALVAGVDGIVIKCHGNSSKRAIFNAICGASQMIDTQLIEKMRSSLLE